jgi:DNA-directed RNA polymerase specialized sigma24 family protein
MLIDRPELDSDLEWMLQSGQANDQVIIETLVNEYYALIFRFTLSCLGINQEARDATLESLATALVESHRYSGNEGARLWLLSIAAKICSRAFRKSSDPKYPSVSTSQNILNQVEHDLKTQSQGGKSGWAMIDILPLEQRLPLLLRVICELTVPEIAVVLDQPEKITTSHLQMAYQQVGSETSSSYPSQTFTFNSGFEKDLATSLQANWPLPYPSSSELEQIKAEVQGKVEHLRRRRRSRTRTLEVSIVGLAMAVVISAVGIANFIQSTQESIPPPSHNSQSTQIPYQGNREAIPTHLATIDPTPTPIRPTLTQQPLNRSSTSEEVYERFRNNSSTWRSLWADVLIYFYGPRGYIGPPELSRQQVWIERDKAGLVIIGPLEGNPVSFVLERITRYAPSSNPGLRNMSFNYPVSWLDFSSDRHIHSPTLFWILFSKEMMHEQTTALQIVRASGEFSGYTALVVDQLADDGGRYSRLWIDVQTGLPLRERFYDRHDPQTVILDVVVNALAIDHDFPDTIFGNQPSHPLRENFAVDSSGQLDISTPRQREFLVDPLAWREPRTLPAAPAGFDPSYSHLTFEIPDESRSIPREGIGMRIYADDYLLAELPPEHPLVFNPLSITCTRSPDGSILAFRDFLTFIEGPPLQQPYKWLRLADVSKVYTTQEKESSYYSSIIFSPDSRHLAMTISEHQAASSPPPPPPPDNQGIPSPAFPRHELHLIDTSTGETQKIDVLMKVPPEGDEGSPLQEDRFISVETVLFWSPDGRYILGFSPDVGASLLAIEVSSGIAIPGEIIDFQFPNIKFSFPALDWQGEFEFLWIYDLSFCVKPSGQ